MTDLRNSRWMYLKGVLFVVTGTLAGGLLLLELPTLKTLVLLLICVWCWMRAYYFAFYVIEHYIDPQYKFAGLWAFVRYLLRERRK